MYYSIGVGTRVEGGELENLAPRAIIATDWVHGTPSV